MVIRAGFDTAEGFALMQRGAHLLTNSTIVPAAYRNQIEKKKPGGGVDILDNPAGMPNCVVALNMAQRMGADPLMVMQNLYIVEGRPAWSSQYIIASINACGKYSPLRFAIEDLGEKDVEYVRYKWEGPQGNKRRIENIVKTSIKDMRCIAWATEKATGERLESPPVTIELAVKEGWFGKEGSKWQTMPEVMLRYRAASFFGKLYAPELLMGIQTAEEVHDTTYDLERANDGTFAVSLADMKSEAVPQPEGKASVPEACTPAPVSPSVPTSPSTQEEPTPTEPAKPNPRAEVEALRESARILWESTGRPLNEIEQQVGLYVRQWTRATCAKVEDAARVVLAQSTTAQPSGQPSGQLSSPEDNAINCPRVDAYIDDVQCAQCHERENCPSWE